MGKRDIGWAVRALNDGEKVRRSGWNGKGMWLEIDMTVTGYEERSARYKNDVMVENFVWMKTANNTYIPWLCSQADLLATDWEMAE